jgi:hypothetical protein
VKNFRKLTKDASKILSKSPSTNSLTPKTQSLIIWKCSACYFLCSTATITPNFSPTKKMPVECLIFRLTKNFSQVHITCFKLEVKFDKNMKLFSDELLVLIFPKKNIQFLFVENKHNYPAIF